MIGIYKITNLLTGKSYIGQSVNIATRWSQHKSISRSIETLDGNELHKDILELGIDNFSFEVIEETTTDKLDEREIYWIAYYDTFYNGYNHTLGGHNNRQLDYNKILLLWNQGLTAKAIAQQMNRNVAVINWALTNLGVYTEEKRERSQELIAAAYTPYQRAVLKLDVNTGNIIDSYDSISAASRALGVDRATFQRRITKT